jgi:hypothetical protein
VLGKRVINNNERRLMSTREHSIATWCKRFQIDLWNLHDRMKAGELILYEKRGEDEVNASAAIRSGGETPAVGSSSYGGEHGC